MEAVAVAQIAQNESCGIPDLLVGIGELSQNCLRDADIRMVIRRSDPQAKDICAILLDDLIRHDAVAQRLGHLASLTVNDPAVGADCLVRCAALVNHRGQQRGLEPSAILVGALQIQISRPLQAIVLFHDSSVGNTAVEPDVHDVIFLGELLTAALALYFRRQEFRQILCPPSISALLAEQSGDVTNGGVVDDGLFAGLAVDDRDRYAPCSLTGDAPVAAVTNHALNALFAPLRNPLDGFDCLDCLILKAIDGTEPLLGCTVDDGLVAAPAVRILVDDLFGCQHCADLGQLCSNGTVCLIGIHTLELACLFGLASLVVYADQNADIVVILADLKVLDAVARCSVYAAGTALQCDVVAHDDRRKAIVQRVLGLHVLQLAAHESTNGLIFGDAGSLHGCGNQLGCHAVIFITHMYQCVLICRTNADCQVARNGPGSGCPDDEVDLLLVDAQLGKQTLVIGYLELDIDGITRIVLVLDLSFCQCSVTVRTPVNRLQSLVHIATLCHLAEHLDLTSLILRLQGQIRIAVMSQASQTLELCHLILDMHHGKITAVLPQINRRNCAIFHTDGLHCLQLDGQSVGIPAGYVGSAETVHVLVLDDEILQHLVQRCTQMNLAVGIGRAVVENVTGLALILGDHLFVQILGLPLLQSIRLTLGQVSTHGEICLGQI